MNLVKVLSLSGILLGTSLATAPAIVHADDEDDDDKSIHRERVVSATAVESQTLLTVPQNTVFSLTQYCQDDGSSLGGPTIFPPDTGLSGAGFGPIATGGIFGSCTAYESGLSLSSGVTLVCEPQFSGGGTPPARVCTITGVLTRNRK